MNTESQTLIQSWNHRSLSGFVTLLIIIHVGILALAFPLVPTLYHSAHYVGSNCQTDTKNELTWYENGYSQGNCIPLADDERRSLRNIATSFRFPLKDDQINHFTTWNWHIVANLMIDVTFLASDVPKQRSDEKFDEYQPTQDQNNITIPVFTIVHRDIPVLMNAKIIIGSHREKFSSSNNPNGKSSETKKNPWKEVASIYAERKLRCSLSKPLHELVQSKNMDRSAQYICSLTPIMDLHLPDDKSYILNVEFKPDLNRTDLDNESFNEYMEFFDNPSDVNTNLTLIIESKDFHKFLFYIKCIFSPFVFIAMVWFCVQMYCNDLYISIPDRVLICCGLAQILQNISTEILAIYWKSAYIKLLDEFSFLILFCSLCLYWVIYFHDKLAKNEPWERNTRYYWMPILLSVLWGFLVAVFIIYDNGPRMKNPFNNHWSSLLNIQINLAFIFVLLGLVMLYSILISIQIFNLLCSIRYQTSLKSNTKMRFIFIYCYIVSLITIFGFLLRTSIKLSLYWNQQFFVDPVPFQLSKSGPLLLFIQAVCNLHIIFLLILLSKRRSKDTSKSSIHYTPGKPLVSPNIEIYQEAFNEQNEINENQCEHLTPQNEEPASHLFTLTEEDEDEEEDDNEEYPKLEDHIFNADDTQITEQSTDYYSESEAQYYVSNPVERAELCQQLMATHNFPEHAILEPDPILSSSSSSSYEDDDDDDESCSDEESSQRHSSSWGSVRFHRTQST